MSYFVNSLFKSRKAFFWYSICLACFSFFMVSSWMWLKTFALKSSNSRLLMQSVATVSIPIPHKTKTKATDKCVFIFQTQQNLIFKCGCRLDCKLDLLCKTNKYELVLGNLIIIIYSAGFVMSLLMSFTLSHLLNWTRTFRHALFTCFDTVYLFMYNYLQIHIVWHILTI